MNGFEFLEAYKEVPEEQKGNLIIVMLTTSLLEKDKEKVFQYESVAEFWNKPLNDESFMEELSRVIGKRKG